MPTDRCHRVYWAAYGNPDGEPLLLVHGGFGHVFDPARLTGVDFTRHHVIVLHQRGMGRSLPRAETAHNGVMDNVRDMERLRRHLDIPAWSIFAWSAGAVLMAAYAARHPDRVRDMTAYAPYLGSNDDYEVIKRKSPEMAVRYFAYHNANTGTDVVRSVFNKAAAPNRATRLKTAFTAAAMWNPELDEKTFYASKDAAAWDDYFATYKLGAALDLELHTKRAGFLGRKPVTQPVTLIYGNDDLWSAPHDYACKVFPQAQTRIIPGAGHDVHGAAVQKGLRPG